MLCWIRCGRSVKHDSDPGQSKGRLARPFFLRYTRYTQVARLQRGDRVFDFSEFPTIQTKRLRLRAFTPDDAPALLEHLGNPAVTRYIDTTPMTTLDEARVWLRWMDEFFAAKDGLRWAVDLKYDANAPLIGSAGLHGWNRNARYAELGFDLSEPHWGQGYATEIGHALIVFGWHQMNLNRIEADVVDGNIGSMRVLEKLGFRREGIWRQRVFKDGQFLDVHQFGLLRREYARE